MIAKNQVLLSDKTSVEKIRLGGIDQYIYIRTHNINNPLLLFFHGGPGLSEFGALKKFNGELEKAYTVVHWDQRGAGKSYSKGIPSDTMNKEQLIKDAHELVRYLLHRFHQEKIFLVAHSWGTCLGLKFAELYPELLSAYIGVSQVINRPEEETLGYAFSMKRAKKSHNPIALRQLKIMDSPKNGQYKSMKDMLVQRTWASVYGGFIHKKLDYIPIFSSIFFAREYSFWDRIKLYKGLNFSLKHLWKDFVGSNYLESMQEIKIPIYFIMGEHDKVTFISMVEKFINKIKAPIKEIFIIPDSAHMCCYEKPEEFVNIILKIGSDDSKGA